MKIANECFDHKIEYDNNSEIERERESYERGKHEYDTGCVHMCRNIIINSYLTSATLLPLCCIFVFRYIIPGIYYTEQGLETGSRDARINSQNLYLIIYYFCPLGAQIHCNWQLESYLFIYNNTSTIHVTLLAR